MEPLFKNNNMEHTINIEAIVTMLNALPASKHDTDRIKVARGKWKLPTSIKQLFKKLKNG